MDADGLGASWHTPLAAKELWQEMRRCQVGSNRYTYSWFFSRFLYFWRHPAVRLLPPLVVVVLDMFSFASDPIDHSRMETAMPVAGEIWNLLSPVRPNVTWYWIILKLLLAALAFFVGISLGNLLRRQMVKSRLSVLRTSRGGHVLPVLCVPMSLYTAALLWNQVLSSNGVKWPDGDDQNQVTRYLTSNFGISLMTFGQIVQSFVFILDFTAFLGVVDMVLQDGSQYPNWGKFSLMGCDVDLRKLWTEGLSGRLRIYFVWGLFAVAVPFSIFFIWREAEDAMHEHETERYRWYRVSELGRARVASLTFWFDVATVCQDWEFPTFQNHVRVAFLGTNIALEGRFLNYVMLFGTMLVDLKSVVAHLMFEPALYGEYVDKYAFIWVITNETVLGKSSETVVNASTFEAREAAGCFNNCNITGGCNQNACYDYRLKALYMGYINDAKHQKSAALSVATVLVPIFVALFMVLVLCYLLSASRWDLCRRVVHCHNYNFEVLDTSSRLVDASLQERARRGLVQLQRRRAISALEVSRAAPARPSGPLPNVELRRLRAPSAEEAAAAVAARKASGDRKSLRLPVNAEEQGDLLLVSGCGVFTVRRHIDSATAKDLKLELVRGGLLGNIPAKRVQLRHRLGMRLEDDEELDAIAGPPDGRAVCIYVLANLNLEDPALQEVKPLREGPTWELPEWIKRRCRNCLRRPHVATTDTVPKRSPPRRASAPASVCIEMRRMGSQDTCQVASRQMAPVASFAAPTSQTLLERPSA